MVFGGSLSIIQVEDFSPILSAYKNVAKEKDTYSLEVCFFSSAKKVCYLQNRASSKLIILWHLFLKCQKNNFSPDCKNYFVYFYQFLICRKPYQYIFIKKPMVFVDLNANIDVNGQQNIVHTPHRAMFQKIRAVFIRALYLFLLPPNFLHKWPFLIF